MAIHGKPATHGAWRLEGRLTGKFREGNHTGEGKAVVHLTLGRRCSRRRLDEEGGAV
jgi:hypothetical protein